MTQIERLGEKPEAEEIGAVLNELGWVRERPPPSDPSSAGCAVAGVALIALVLVPFVASTTDVSGRVLAILVASLALVVLFGGMVGIFGGASVRRSITADVEAAVDQLIEAFPEGDEQRMREAAVRILDGAVTQVGPTMVSTFNTLEVADRLGPALAYVERIERILLARGEIYGVFTGEALGDQALQAPDQSQDAALGEEPAHPPQPRAVPKDLELFTTVEIIRLDMAERWWSGGAERIAREPRVGDRGDIVEVSVDEHRTFYIVELFDEQGDTICTCVVRQDEIRPITR